MDVDDDGVDIAMARGDVMQTFTIGVGHRWWTGSFRRNPLVRGSDRIEVLVLGFAVLFIVVAIPVAGAIGTFVHDARTRVYAEEALTRHEVIATAIEDGVIVVQPPTSPRSPPAQGGLPPVVRIAESSNGWVEPKSVTSKLFG